MQNKNFWKGLLTLIFQGIALVFFSKRRPPFKMPMAFGSFSGSPHARAS